MCYKSIKSQMGRLCTILLTIVGFPATSRCGPPTSRRQIYMSLSRRDVEFARRDVTFTLLCYVATSIYTSRHGLVQVSVTSRRGPERRDVVWSCALSRRDVDPNVATLACLLSVTSQDQLISGFSPHTLHIETLAFPAHQLSPDLSEPLSTLVGGLSIVLRPPLCSYKPPSSPGTGP